MEERLQKLIAAAGLASRRHAEELIAAGEVTVNGEVVREPGTKADPARDHIKVNGKLLKGRERFVYLMLHKPKGYVSTVSDPEERQTIMDLLHGVTERVYPIGRLDYASEGLLLLTNDGDLANKLTKAASHVPKTYLVKVAGVPPRASLDKLCHGIDIWEEEKGRKRRVRTAPCEIRAVRQAENPWFEVTLIEGRNRQIRKMFEEIGHHVEKIKRVRYGPLELRNMNPGDFRSLDEVELRKLKLAAEGRALQKTRPPKASEKLAKSRAGRKPFKRAVRRNPEN